METTQAALPTEPIGRWDNTAVRFAKSDGTEHVGTYHDDGLSSLTSVNLTNGGTAYLSTLDRILDRQRLAGTRRGSYEIAGDTRWTR